MGNLRGATLMVLAMAGFAIEDMFIKFAARDVPSGQVLVMAGLGGAAIYGLWALIRGEAPVTAAMFRGASGLRALFEGIAGTAFVTALALVPLSLVTTIMQTSPLLVTLGAAVFLSEPVGPRRWSAIVVGLFGVMIVIQPWGTGFEPSALFAVVGVLAMAARDLATRAVPQSISTVQLSTLGFAAIIPGGALSLLLTDTQMVWPTTAAWWNIAGLLGIGIPALYAVIAAMRVGEVSFVAPFRYSRIVFGLAIGVVVFGETLGTNTLIGAAIVVCAGTYTFLREAQLRKRPSPILNGTL